MVTYNGKTLPQLVKGQTVAFAYARKGELWYKLADLLFPVPFEDMGDGTFMSEDKATMFMRYIRKHLESIEKEQHADKADKADNKTGELSS